MDKSIKKIVVVAGCQRSGTTLVGQILGAHPKAVLIDEPDGLYSWFQAHCANEPNADSELRDMLARARVKYRPKQKRIKTNISGETSIMPNVTHVILKAPNLTFAYKKISKLDTPVSVVYPVRNPRSVLVSMAKLKHISMIERQTNFIKGRLDLANEFGDEIATLENVETPDHIKRAMIWSIKSCLFERFIDHGLLTYKFKYEDLVENKARICTALAAHVGLDFNNLMLKHESVFRGFGPGLTERSRPIDRLSVDKWALSLTPKHEEDLLKFAGKAMKKLGYLQVPQKKDVGLHQKIQDEKLSTPIILTGRGGSGTRLLSEIAQSAGVFLGNRLNPSQDSLEWASLFYEMVVNNSLNRKKGVVNQTDKWDSLLISTARDVLEQSNWNSGQLWGWKLPESMLIVPELFSAFSGAKLVHLVRHPVDSSLRRSHLTSRMNNPIGRAVLKSAYEHAGLELKPPGKNRAYMQNAISWRYQVETVTEFARKNLNSDQYLEIRFEDFCEDPDTVQKKLLQFIGTEQDFPRLANVEQGRLRKYKSSDHRVGEVWDLCKETALKLGYKPVH